MTIVSRAPKYDPVYRLTRPCLKPPKPPLGTVTLLLRQHHAIEVSQRSNGNLDVWCSLCHEAWRDVPDHRWPTMHAGTHNDE